MRSAPTPAGVCWRPVSAPAEQALMCLEHRFFSPRQRAAVTAVVRMGIASRGRRSAGDYRLVGGNRESDAVLRGLRLRSAPAVVRPSTRCVETAGLHQKRGHGCSAGRDRVDGGAAARRVGWLLRLGKSGADGRASDHLPLRHGAAVTRSAGVGFPVIRRGMSATLPGGAPIAQRSGRRISPP